MTVFYSDGKIQKRSIKANLDITMWKVKNQLDRVMVDYRIRLSIKDIRSIRESSALSDHFLVRTKVKIRISGERAKRMKSTKKINKKMLKGDQAKDYKEKINEYLNVSDHYKDRNHC